MNMKKTLTAALLLGSANVSLATPFGPGTDLGMLNDYYYYLENPSDGRAEHEATGGGLYTLGSDKTWSSLVFRNSFGSTPAVFDLRGNTLTLTGCDAQQKPFYFGSQAESTVVISNGTVNIVYSPEMYPWTLTENKYADRKGGVWGRGKGTLVIAKDGKLSSDTALTTSSSGNRLVVQDGGDLDAPVYPWGGSDTRIVFEKGAKFSRISSYVSSGSFPANIWYESGYVSNVFEFCDEKLLSDAGVVQLNPGSYPKAGSFHCGIALRSSDFDYTLNALGFSSGAAPVLFEILDGAKLNVSKTQIQFGSLPAMSGSRINVAGSGSMLSSPLDYPLIIGSSANCSNGLICVSGGGVLDFTYGTVKIAGNDAAGADWNAIEVASGGTMKAKAVVIGFPSNDGNRLVAVGNGTSVKFSGALTIRSPKTQNKGHILRVADGAEVSVGGVIGLGSASGTAGGSSIELFDGAFLTNEVQTIVYGPGCRIKVADSTYVSRQFKIGTESAASETEVEISGRDALMKSTDWGTVFANGANVRIEVPEGGFAEAPLQAIGDSYISFDASCAVTIDATDFMKGSRGIATTLLISSEKSAVSGQDVLNAARIVPEGRVSLKWSADKKKLYLRRNNLGMSVSVR